MQKKWAASVLVMDAQYEVMSHDALVVEADNEADAISVTQTWAKEEVRKNGIDPGAVKITVKVSETTGGKKNVDICHDSKLHQLKTAAPTVIPLWSPVIDYGPMKQDMLGNVHREVTVGLRQTQATLENGFATIQTNDSTLFLPAGTVREDRVEWAKTEVSAMIFLRDVFVEQSERADLVRLAAEKAVSGYNEIIKCASKEIVGLTGVAS